MSLMTPEERQKMVPKGLYVKFKCDGCGKPIMSPLTFTGPNGEDFCSRACLGGSDHKHKEPKMAKEVKDAKSTDKPKPSKNKAAVPAEDDKELRRKKKAAAAEDDEEEATPKKKAKKKASDEEEAKPKKKKRVVEEEEDEAPPKKKKAKKAADEEDDDEAPAKKKSKSKDAPAAKPGTNPYSRPGTVVYDVFEMAKAGTTVKAINTFLKERDCAPARVWRELKSGEMKGVRWRYLETEDGKVTVKIKTAK